uniref:Outer membrane lipoprotein omp16 n=1 Tax=uncultured Thiotrichaceae bacterium TaxID=298394 RepID=A0A6S6UFR4_9GAMM|nr:MAG: Outer membrane lipoprotein omp16 precursor [uncultured Thiotrichaceae bacterium]
MLLKDNLFIFFWFSLFTSGLALAGEKHIQGTVVDHLTRQSLGQVTVSVFKNEELVQQQILNEGEDFSINFDYNKDEQYALTASKKGYIEERVVLSRALVENTIPEKMKLSLGGDAFQFTGKISDRTSGESVPNARIKLANKMTGEVIETASDYQGNYTLRITSGYEYEILTVHHDYLKRYSYINYCKDTLKKEQKYCFRGFLNLTLGDQGGVGAATTLMDKIIIGKAFIVDNIYYDYNKATLREDGLPNLDRVFHILTDNPQLIVELGSHADSRGSDGYNLKLSQQRAESAVAYIIEKGMAEKRINAKGYGEQSLLNHCKNDVSCTEAEHENNRRTEFTIIDIDEDAIQE